MHRNTRNEIDSFKQLVGEATSLAADHEHRRKSVAYGFVFHSITPAGEDATVVTLLDLAQAMNSCWEHLTSFCEKSEPMLALTTPGS